MEHGSEGERNIVVSPPRGAWGGLDRMLFLVRTPGHMLPYAR